MNIILFKSKSSLSLLSLLLFSRIAFIASAVLTGIVLFSTTIVWPVANSAIDLAELSIDELQEIINITEDDASTMIMKAREHLFK